jgi:hypothetical protein
MSDASNMHPPAENAELVDTEEEYSLPLTNSRHEIFAQHRALSGATLSQCYVLAGGKSIKNVEGQAGKWAARADVKGRIAFLKAEQVRRMQDEHVFSRREILEELKTNVYLGREVKGGLPASNKALELIGGEEHDMFVVRKENRNRKVDELDGLDQAQIIAYIQKGVDRIPGLDIDAEALAAAIGVKGGPELGPGRPEGDSEANS